jgi:uncharacterized protein YutE (UPF0331/DUF86 family)
LLGAAALKAAGAIFDVIANVEAYDSNIQALTDRKIISAEDAQQLRDASAAFARLGTELTNLAVSVAATVAPVVGPFFDLVSNFVVSLNAGMTVVGNFANSIAGYGDEASTAARKQRELNTELITQLRVADAQEQSTKRQKELEKNLADDRASLANMFAEDQAEAEARTRKIEEAAKSLLAAEETLHNMRKSARLEEADARDKIILKAEQQRESVQRLIEQHPELTMQGLSLIRLYDSIRDSALAAFDAEERRKQIEANERQNAKIKKQVESITQAYREQQQAIREAQAEVMQATADTVVSIVGDIQSSLSSVTAMFDTSTKQGKKAARNLATAQRVLAVYQVGINLAQAIAQSLAQGGPVAGAALAAAVSSAFAGLIATVSQPIPQFHTGRFGASSGMLTDERMTGGVMTVAPEVVIPPDLVSRSGGADGVRSRLEDDRPMIVQAVIDLTDERIVLPLSRALGARERGRIGIPLGRT